MARDFNDDVFRRKSQITQPRLMVVVMMGAVLTGGGLAYIHKTSENAARATKSDILKGRYEHLRMLEETKKNLTALTDYITKQVERLRSTNELLGELEKQRDRLKPLVETDMQTVNALFQVQEERTMKTWWRDFVLTLVLGAFGQFGLTLLWDMFQRWRRAASQP